MRCGQIKYTQMKCRQETSYPSVVWAALCIGMLVAQGCGSSPDRINDSKIRDITHPQLMSLLQGERDGLPAEAEAAGKVVLLDVRAPRHYAQGRLPGAVNIFLPDLKAGDPRLADADAIVAYAQTWQDSLGPAAAKRLITLGYENVYLYRGGVELWIARGGQLEGGE